MAIKALVSDGVDTIHPAAFSVLLYSQTLAVTSLNNETTRSHLNSL